MGHIITFNTNRLYTEKGQRSAARVVGHTEQGDALVALLDIDRGIDGTYVTMCVAHPTADHILAAYDYDFRAGYDAQVPYHSPVWGELRTAASAL